MDENATSQSCQSCSDSNRDWHPLFALCHAKRFDEALALCHREIAENPERPAGYRHAAIVFQEMGRNADARAFRDKVVELAPDCTMSYYSRADLLYEIGDWGAAAALSLLLLAVTAVISVAAYYLSRLNQLD